MKVPVLNQKGEKVKEIVLPEEIFNVEINQDLVHQVVLSQRANQRQGSAHTKDRSEVRGGGRKPWRQKGTGRARHGSIRSPLWKGGGVTFGPRNEKSYKKRIPQVMKRKALFMVLSGKLKDNEIFFIDDLKTETFKTKDFQEIIKNLPLTKKSNLFVLPQVERRIILGLRNIPGTKTVLASNINVLELLSYNSLIILEDSIKKIKETWL
jgi:large subunit ribosomal protein L4